MPKIDGSKRALRRDVGRLKASFLTATVTDATGLTSRSQHDTLKRIAAERQAITSYLRTQTIVDPNMRYNLEYRTAAELFRISGKRCDFSGTHYWFYSPILEEVVLRRVLGDNARKRIIDLGCGDGTLIRRFLALGVRSKDLLGIDISAKAVRRVEEIGVRALEGRIEHHCRGIGQNSTDVVIHSYLIDRDENQKVTFIGSIPLLRRGGFLVVEGLFPCELIDSNGVSYGVANLTHGKDLVQDIMDVVVWCRLSGAVLREIIVGQRLVYSLDGPEVLPTYILVFEKH